MCMQVDIKLRKMELQQWSSLEETNATKKTKKMPSFHAIQERAWIKW